MLTKLFAWLTLWGMFFLIAACVWFVLLYHDPSFTLGWRATIGIIGWGITIVFVRFVQLIHQRVKAELEREK